MKAEDLLYLISDSTNVAVYDSSGQYCLSEYDGKNSIDPKYNDMEILSIRTTSSYARTYIVLVLDTPEPEEVMSFDEFFEECIRYFTNKGMPAERTFDQLRIYYNGHTSFIGLHRYYDAYANGADIENVLCRIRKFIV